VTSIHGSAAGLRVPGDPVVIIEAVGGSLLAPESWAPSTRAACPDSVTAFLAVLGVSIPDFGARAAGTSTFSRSSWGCSPQPSLQQHSWLPSLVLSTVAVVATFTRRRCSKVLGQDYVTLAEVKGLSRLAMSSGTCSNSDESPVVTIAIPLPPPLVTGTWSSRRSFHTGLELFVRSLTRLPDHHRRLPPGVRGLFCGLVHQQDILLQDNRSRIRVAGNRE